MIQSETVHSLPAVHPPGPGLGIPGARLLRLGKDPLGLLSELTDQYGDIVRARIGFRPVYFLNHPEFIREVLVTKSSNFVKGAGLQQMRQILGDGLLTSEGETHRRQRAAALPAFQRAAVEQYVPIMVQETAKLAASWQDGQRVHLPSAMNRLTLLIAGQSLFGYDLTDQAVEIGLALDGLMAESDPLHLLLARWLQWLPGRRARRLQQAQSLFDQIAWQMTRSAAPQQGEPTLLQMLQEYGSQGGCPHSSSQFLRDHIVTFLLAGHETTANALAWSLFLLSRHPESAACFHAELDELLGGRPPAAQDLPRLRYTRAVFSEALRLYPPAWGLGRMAQDDCHIGKYHVPGGASVVMSPWLVQRDPRFFPQPEQFRPERWLAPRGSGWPKQAFFPFGSGPRACIGAQFAWAEGVMVLAALGQRWRVQFEEPEQVLVQPRVTLRMGGVANVIVRGRPPR